MSIIIRRDGGEELALLSPNRSTEETVNLTEHPIEGGSFVSDHAEVMPIRLSLDARISETPLGDPEPARIRDALRFLLTIGVRAERVEVQTRYRTFSNMVLVEWPHDETQLRGLQMSLVFRQVRIADVETVTLPREVPRVEVEDDVPEDTDVGTQPKEDVDESESEEVNRSWLASGIDWAL